MIHLAAAVAASAAKLCTFLFDMTPVVNSSFAFEIEAPEDLRETKLPCHINGGLRQQWLNDNNGLWTITTASGQLQRFPNNNKNGF